MYTVVHRKCKRGGFRSHERHFQVSNIFLSMDPGDSGYLVRYNGTWHLIKPKPYEPERMTTDVAWIQLKEGVDAATAYRRWFEKQRKLSRLLQQ